MLFLVAIKVGDSCSFPQEAIKEGLELCQNGENIMIAGFFPHKNKSKILLTFGGKPFLSLGVVHGLVSEMLSIHSILNKY